MEINEFIANFADQFDETEPNEIVAETKFHDLDEWSSLIALSVLNMVNKTYGYNMTFDEVKSCDTVEDVFNLVKARIA